MSVKKKERENGIKEKRTLKREVFITSERN